MADFGRANSLYEPLTDDIMMKLGPAKRNPTKVVYAKTVWINVQVLYPRVKSARQRQTIP
jgi:hypothetical protein